MRQFSSKSLILLVFTLIISACASLPDQKELNQRAENLAQKSSKSSQSTLQQAKLKLQKAHTESLAFYAPTYYQNAQAAYEKAQQLYNANADDADIRIQAQLTIEWIESGLRNKKIVDSYLVKSLSARDVLLKLKADEYFPEPFKAIEEQQLALIKQVEQRHELAAKKAQKALLDDMAALEVTTIGHTYLSQTYTMMKQAEALNAQTLLPKTYGETLKQIKETEQYIRQNPRNTKTIDGLAKDSLFVAERLFSLAGFAVQLTTAKEQAVETLVLKQEQHIQGIAEAIHYKDVRNLSLDDQSLLLSQYGKKLVKQRKDLAPSFNSQEELEKWKRKVALLEAEVRRLEKQRP